MLFASTVTAATTAIRCWIFDVSQSLSLVSNLQSPPSCTTKTTAFPLPLCILLRLHFCKYHYDCLAPIYSSMELSQLLEISRAAMHQSKFWPNLSTLFKHHQCCSDLVAPANIKIIFFRSTSSKKNRPYRTSHAPPRAAWSFCSFTSHAHAPLGSLLTSSSIVISHVNPSWLTYWCHPLIANVIFNWLGSWLIVDFLLRWSLAFSQSWLFAIQVFLAQFFK